MRICIVIATKRVLEMQSDATEGTLVHNAMNMGYAVSEVEEREVDAAGYAAALAEDPVWIAEQAAQQSAATFATLKLQEIAENLPTWQQVANAIDGVTTIAGLRVVVKKIARIVYLLAKNSAD